MKFQSFCGPSMSSQSPLASLERTVNWIPQRIHSEGAKTRVAMYPVPGLAGFAASPETSVRGMFAEASRCFAMIGTKFKEVNSLGSLTDRGTIATDASPAQATSNGDGGDQMFVASGNKGYSYDRSAHTFTEEITGVTMVGMLDGRVLALDTATSTLKISDLLDATGWDPTQIAQRSTAPDPWKAMLVVDADIWLLGEETGDVWYNSGASPFPFAPRTGLRITPGIAAPFSLVTLNGRVYWLSRHKQIVRADGYAARPVSTDGMDYAIGKYSRVDDAVAYTYIQSGHAFVAVNFPTADATWVYDETEDWWHERGKWNGTSGMFEAWGPQSHVEAFGHHLVGDHRSGTIYRMAHDVYVDAAGAPMRRMRQVPGPFAEHEQVSYDRLQVYVEPGLQGGVADPQLMLRKSKDGGKTWGSARWRSAGEVGKYLHRAQWHQLGTARDMAFELTVSDAYPWNVVDAFLDASVVQ